MKALLRILVLWLLMAGVPLQGFAAATMLLCAPSAPAPQMTAGHDHAAMLAAQQHDDHHSQDTHHGDAKCAGAAFCCTGAPLAGTMPVTPHLPDVAGMPIPFDSAAPAAVDLAGLERPPKHLA